MLPSLFLLLTILSCSCAESSSIADKMRIIDLSYRHNVEPKVIANALASLDPSPLQVDISSSALGDDGVERILQTLLSSSTAAGSDDDVPSSTSSPPTTTTTTTPDFSTTKSNTISFISQMNQITAKGATRLIQMILSTTSSSQSERPQRRVECLDLSWNHFHGQAAGLEDFHTALEQFMGNATHCPRILRFDRCGMNPAACRAIGKGLIHRYTHNSDGQEEKQEHDASVTQHSFEPTVLSLCGNPAIGDAGAAAIAAAIRFVATSEDINKKSNEDDNIMLLFERLDLSACDIGDVGVEALAMALESSSHCLIKHLDLSNNRITEKGAQALGRALATAAAAASAMASSNSKPLLVSLDLSNNELGDAGASSIATFLVEKELVPSIIVRSCHIHADGAQALGKALRKFSQRRRADASLNTLSLDLSGNPFGVLRGKKKDGGKYSASRLKSKASATAASYMNQGISFLKKGLKDVGVDVGLDSAESDDEEEKRTGNDSLMDSDIDPSRARCGARALCSAFVEENNSDNKKHIDAQVNVSPRRIQLGLRHCFFDHAAADALAEMKVVAKDDLEVELELDVRLNPVLEDEMVSALHGEDEDYLREMAEAHMEKMRIIREAEERAKEATQALASREEARAKAYAAYEASWDAPTGYGEDLSEWDSDAEYDNEADMYH